MTDTKICTFCLNKGIRGPHNHTVRKWTEPGRPIICPNLLKNVCPVCKQTGHTKQYCPTLQSINRNIKRELEDYQDMEIHNSKLAKHF
tara:strand:+ start:67 stop:330 length:264 start_codon:yes stop_codon:yes gene_type:complete